jgi:transcriptional regulator with XRE-family HTH domain
VERDRDGRHLPPAGFGGVLRAARLARGWSYRVAADRIGISFGFLAELERGNRCPSESVAWLLVDRLGLSGGAAAAVCAAAVPDAGRDWPGSRR